MTVLLSSESGVTQAQWAECSVWQIPSRYRGNGTATSLLDLAGLLPGLFYLGRTITWINADKTGPVDTG
jgi:hypothetical protein